MLRRPLLATAVAVAALLALVAPSPVDARPGNGRGNDAPTNARQFRDAVETDDVIEHLEAFQAIADEHGGTRSSGTPGYEASVDYVVDVLRDAGYRPRVQEFEFPFFQALGPSTFEQVTPTPTTYVEETDYFLAQFSGPGDVTGTLRGVDNVFPPTPEANGNSAGCETEDFAGFTPGNIALIQRGTCPFEDKVANAEAAQAAGVVLFNEGQEGRTEAFVANLGRPFSIPVVTSTFAVADALNASLEAGEEVTVHLVTDTLSETRTTWNVLADTRKGRANRVVVVGAHLDSVLEGPGINDNGSGSAGILEIAEELAEVRRNGLKNRVRFAFWGAEEFNLLGSQHYVSSLSEQELAKIALNLNFDMIGSPNFVRFVYDGDGSDTGTAGPEGSDRIEQVFLRYFERQGLETEPTAFDGRSDYGPFIAVGIPAGGLFTGAEDVKTPEEAVIYGGTAGIPYDPCYHQACDTIDNVSEEALDQMVDAAADSTWRWSTRRIPRRAPAESSIEAARAVESGQGHAITS